MRENVGDRHMFTTVNTANPDPNQARAAQQHIHLPYLYCNMAGKVYHRAESIQGSNRICQCWCVADRGESKRHIGQWASWALQGHSASTNVFRHGIAHSLVVHGQNDHIGNDDNQDTLIEGNRGGGPDDASS